MLLSTERQIPEEPKRLVPLIFTRLGCRLGLDTILTECADCVPLLVVNKWAPFLNETVRARGVPGGGARGGGGGGGGCVPGGGGCQVMGTFCNYRMDMLKRLSNGSIANGRTTPPPPPSLPLHNYSYFYVDLFIIFQIATLEEVAADVIIVGIQAAQNNSIKVKCECRFIFILELQNYKLLRKFPLR